MAAWIESVYKSKKRLTIPVMTHPGIEALGYKVIDAVTDGEIHYKAIKYMAEKYPSYACTTIMDLTVEAEAFGCNIDFPENEVPNVTGRLVCDAESVDSLNVPELNAGRVPEYLKATKLAVENITGHPVFSGCIGPFSLAGRLYDMSEIMIAIYTEPDVIIQLLDKCTEFIIKYCKELKRLGASGVFIAEPAAGLLSNDDCMIYSTTYVRKIVDALQDENFSIILHNCGNTGQCTQAMIDSGADALHFGNAIDMIEALKVCPENIVVMGNIDPVGVIKQATPDKVKQVTLDLLNNTSVYKNFVLSTGCDVPPHVAEENINAYYDALSEYNSNK